MPKNQTLRASSNANQNKGAGGSELVEAGDGFSSRLKEAIQGRKLPRFATDVGVSLSTLKNWLSGASEPGLQNLVSISRVTGATLNWLATGEGELGGAAAAADLGEGFVLVPQYDIEASAGPGALVDREHVVDFLAFKGEWVRYVLRCDPDRLALISGIGDSMEPTITSGDLLLVDTGVTHFVDDAIYVVSIDGQLMVKRIQRFFGGTIVIRSDNEHYVEHTLSPDEAAEVNVAGRVRWVGRLI